MIRSLEIENFRGIQSGKLENLTPLTILVGPNSSGKSTVLDALFLSASPSAGDALVKLMDRRKFRESQWLIYQPLRNSYAKLKLNTVKENKRIVELTKPVGQDAIGDDLR